MSANNQLSVVIPPAVIAEVTTKLQEIKLALAPFLQGLTSKDRKELFKMGDKTVATVSKIKSYLSTNPEFVQTYMDTAEFLKDEAVVAQLDPIANLLAQLNADTQDTLMLAGSEALLSSLLYYGSIKQASSKGIATAKPIYEDLKERFSKKRSSKTPPINNV